MSRTFLLGCALGLIAGGMALAATLTVSQRGRAFDVKTLSVKAGDVVEFVNDDEFVHQIYVSDPAFNFDSEEAAPGAKIPLRFTKAGTFEVRCHIHPKMLVTVTVE